MAMANLIKQGVSMEEQEVKWQEIIEEYLSEKWACEDPCNSYAVCNNCGDAKLIKVGIAFAEKNIHEIPSVAKLLTALENLIEELEAHGIHAPARIAYAKEALKQFEGEIK